MPQITLDIMSQLIYFFFKRKKTLEVEIVLLFYSCSLAGTPIKGARVSVLKS